VSQNFTRIKLSQKSAKEKNLGLNKKTLRKFLEFVEENYSWEKQSKMLYNVFKELVERNFDEFH
jgi:glycosyltransferase involved in cell wall biosynthesis